MLRMGFRSLYPHLVPTTASPKLPGTLKGVGYTLYLTILGLAGAGVGAWLLTGLDWNMWITLPVTILLTMLLIRYASPPPIKNDLNRQFSFFRSKHNWVMMLIYTMTLGSYIGFSSAFPLLRQ